MRRVRYSVAMSLDGFIAGPKGESDWIVMDPEIDFKTLIGSFDTILMGGGGMPGLSAYVFSRSLSQKDCPGVVVSSDPKATIAEIKTKPGKDLWLFGGGGLFRSLIDLRLVDAIEVSVIPVVLGSGTPLLPEGKRHKLKLEKQRVYAKTGTLGLEYSVAS
jgi:dihydrofolate reductase